MSISDLSLADEATAYAEAVLSGKIVAGEFVRAACRRHTDDLANGAARGLTYRPEVAKRAIRFFPTILTITEGVAAGKPFELLPWHRFVVGSLFGWHRADGLRRFRQAWLETGKGQAKALALDTPIPTPSGWTTMGELKDGDLVFGANGSPCRVLKAHPVVTSQFCYRVSFDDGSAIIANAGHLWKTEMRRSGNRGHGDATRGVKRHERGKWRNGIRTTEQIARTLRYANGKHQSANHSVALARPLDGDKSDLPIHPYVLGFWLGDGDSDGPRLTIGDRDIAESSRLLREAGVTLGKRRGTKERAGRYMPNIGAACRDGIGARLKKMGLLCNKHIPAIYLRASAEQRWHLLRGLMDTDGSVTDRQCSFTSVKRALADGFFELAVSLGLKATMNEFTPRINGRDCGRGWRIEFFVADDANVFGLPRKQDLVQKTHARRCLCADRKIVGCEPVESVPVRCITVDSDDSLFLCGRTMIPTHNSPLMAAVGIYLCGFVGKSRPECYAIASDRDQANVLFRDAVAMCRSPIPGYDDDGDTLESRGEVVIRGTGDNAWKIEFPSTGGKFQSLASVDAISGPRPYAVLADEIHEMKTARALQLWKASIDKMSGDPIMILGTNTPAADQTVGTEYSEMVQRVVTGQAQDDATFGFIARVDTDDDPLTDELCWGKALPALGITYPVENVRARVSQAKLMLSEMLATKRLYFGIPVGSTEFWISEEAWNSAQGVVDEDSLKGRPCWLSLDLSNKNDLTALTACWRDGDRMAAKTWFFTTRDHLADRERDDGEPYSQWVAQGLMTAVPGAVIDKAFVAVKVQQLCVDHDVQFMAYDSAMISDFIAACEDIGLAAWKYEGPDKPAGEGLKMVSHGQGTRILFKEGALSMPKSIVALDDAILNGAITIDENRVSEMCARNACVIVDAMNNRAFDKKRSRGRIDGMVTLAMAVGAACYLQPATASFWETA